MANCNLREKMQEYKRETGYDKMTKQERRASAKRFIVYVQNVKKYDPASLEKEYLAVRKGILK